MASGTRGPASTRGDEMTPEQKFWQLLKPHIPGHVNRIENSVANGMPDVNFAYGGKETWLELKANVNWLYTEFEIVERPKGLRESQLIWHNQRKLYGDSRILVITRDKDIIKILEALGKYKYQAC